MNQMQHDFSASPVAQRDYSAVLGTPFKVFLSNGVSECYDATSGKVVTEIVDLPGLIAAVVQSRALHPRKLSGDDMKYIRSALCVKSNEIAAALDFSPEHYSRCETGIKTMSPEKEKFYRMYVFLGACVRDRQIQDKLSKQTLLEKSLKPGSPEDAEKAVAAFAKIFLEMKLIALYPAGDELAFWFSRRTVPQCPPGRDERDGKWLSEAEREAA